MSEAENDNAPWSDRLISHRSEHTPGHAEDQHTIQRIEGKQVGERVPRFLRHSS
jgi:hypothetical protein